MSSRATAVTPGEEIRRTGLTMPLFAASIFLAAALVFLIEPMAAKMVLPLAGGTPAVWAVSLVFFQAVLLAGYSWAHLSLRLLPLRVQPFVQLPLLLAPLAVLPIAIGSEAPPDAGGNPALWLLGVLALGVGLPFFAVTTASPVLQRWFSASGHGASADPYFLYAASNAGSLIGLLAYPLLLEPRLTLDQQSRAWLLGYGLFVLLAALCAFRLFAAAPAGLAVPPRRVARGVPLPARTRVRWVALAALPSSLVLGTTSHLSTSIASVPLLWVMPLAVYLLTFVLAFARSAPLSARVVQVGVVVSSLLVAASLLHVLAVPIAALVLVHCANLFFVALLVHRRLADERPAVERLTEFYLLLSLGGVVGGAFNALAAPQLFDSIAEYPLALVLALLVLPGRKALRRDLVPAALFAAALLAALVGAAAIDTAAAARVALGLAVLGLALFARRPLRLALGAAALLALATFGQQSLHAERTFFGVVRVVDGPHGQRLLAHGVTIHGTQSLDPRRRREPLAYYTRRGPLGQVFASRAGELERVGVIGLGAGAIAAYGRPGDRYTFYEIDPAVARVASDRRWFTFLSGARADVRVVLGDGRLRIAGEPRGTFDLIVLDAFSSDSVPVHLLTREAVQLYLGKLAADGLVALHVTNNHLDMEPVVGGVARSLGLVGLAQDQHVSEAAKRAGALRSHWVVLARDRADFGRLADDRRWRPLAVDPGRPVWTDQFSNILSVVDWTR